MTVLLLLLTLVGPVQDGFSSFGYCRESLQAVDPDHCIDLSATGAGVFRIVARDQPDEDVEDPFTLSPRALDRLGRLIRDTAYLLEADDYESSSRQLANVGRKTFVLEGEWGTRSAAFNYSARSEVNRLVSFMEGLIGQRLLLLDLEFTMQFDRLNLPGVLERLDGQLRADRFPDPEELLEPLREIAADSRVVNIARTAAADLVQSIEDR